MTTPAKTESNRRNAQRSTGPRTKQGKAVSSKNAVRHGLLSRHVALPDEDLDALNRFRTELVEQLDPQGPLEELLAERVMGNAWRLRRVCRLESAVLAHRTADARAGQTEKQRDTDPIAAGVIRDAAGADTLSKLSRYERSLERGMYRALHELQRLQASRSGQNVPPPAVLDVDVSSNRA